MRRCANESKCVEAAVGALATRSPLCDGCADAAERDVRALPEDYRALGALPPSGGSALTQRVAGSTEPRVPMRLDVDQLQRDMVWSLTCWEPVVRELARLAPERSGRVRPLFSVVEAVNVIAPRIHLLASVPPIWGRSLGLAAGLVHRSGLDAVDDLRDLHRRARALLGTTKRVTRLPGDCPGCGAFALERGEGADEVGCVACGQTWSDQEYRLYVGLVLAAMPFAAPQDGRRAPNSPV